MSASGSTNTPQVAATPGDHTNAVEGLIQEIAGATSPSALNARLKDFKPKEAREQLLASILPSGEDPLSLLDPEQNTIGCLYILVARLSATAQNAPTLRVIEDFCTRFNPDHARLAPERVTTLAKSIVRAAEGSGNVKYSLKPLRSLLTRYPPNLSFLTTLHPIYLTQCVAAKHFTSALSILSVPIMNIDTKISDLTYNDNLVYHYAGGMALGALKKWREAEEYFEICVTAPSTSTPASIQLEALKKLTLVQLILYGKTNPMPKYTHQLLLRQLKNSPYGAFARAYPQPISNLQTTVSKDADVFSADNNMGLVKQAVERAPRWLIQKLTSTYLTLGLGDIAKEAKVGSEAEVRAIILDMVDSGEISATISVNGTVTFSDATFNVSRSDLDRALANAQQQSKLLMELERALHVSKEYLIKALKHKDEAGWGVDDDGPFNLPPGGSGSWGDDSMFA